MLVQREGVTEQAPRRCSRPRPAAGLDPRVLGLAELSRVKGRARGQEEGAGLCFFGGETQESRPGLGGRLGQCWAPSQLQLEHQCSTWRGPLPSPGG